MILNYGTDFGDFEGVWPTGYTTLEVESNTTAAQIATYCQTGVSIKAGVTSPLYLDFAAQTDFWTSGYYYTSVNDQANLPLWEWRIAGVAKWRIVKAFNGNSSIRGEVWNGSSWDDVTGFSTALFPNGTLRRIDVRLNISDTGNFQVYVDGVLDLDFSGDTLRDVDSTADELRLGVNASGSGLTTWSGVFISTADTTGIDAVQLKPNAAGSTSAWSLSDFNNVNDLGIVNDADMIHTATDNLVTQFGLENLAGGLSSRTVDSLAVKARALTPAGINGELEVGVRSGTTDGWGSVESLTNLWLPYFATFATNPDTAAAWTTTEIDSAEIGVRSGVV